MAQIFKELGFGSKSFKHAGRLINPDGKYNVKRRGGGLASFSLYQWMIEVNGFWLVAVILVGFVLINLVFAGVYFGLGLEHLTESEEYNSSWDQFLHCYFFSAQTLTTVGYGRISPVGTLTTLIATFEAMLGLLLFALATGVMYGRFSKARSKILYSEHILVAPFHQNTALKFRLANLRSSQLIELQAKVMYSFLTKNEKGVEIRKYLQLKLEIETINLFPLPWTVVHKIDEHSPFFRKTMTDLKNEDCECVVLLKGYDETFNQYVHQVFSYKYTQFVFDAEFEPMFDTGAIGFTEVFLDKIDDYKMI